MAVQKVRLDAPVLEAQLSIAPPQIIGYVGVRSAISTTAVDVCSTRVTFTTFTVAARIYECFIY